MSVVYMKPDVLWMNISGMPTSAVAYINKALNWPTIKSDEEEVLNFFGLHLTGCRSAMTDVEYMEALDYAATLHAIYIYIYCTSEDVLSESAATGFVSTDSVTCGATNAENTESIFNFHGQKDTSF